MTVTSTINQNLPYIAIASCVVLIGILLHRITRIFCTSLIAALFLIQEKSEKTPLKQFAHRGLIGQAVQFFVLIFVCFLRLIITALRLGGLIIYTLLPLVILAVVLALIQQRWSEFMLILVEMFNGPFGSTLQMMVTIPLSILDTVGVYILPIYNLFVLIFVQAPLQFLLWMFKGNAAYHAMAGLRSIGDATPILATNVKAFVNANSVSCETSGALCTNISHGEGVLCTDIDSPSAATVCLDPSRRELKLSPVFDKLRVASGHFLITLGTSCEAVGLMANVTLYPTTDPVFWSAVESFINGILFATVGAPSSAIQRCKLAGGFSARPAMCTPDFGPAFKLLADASQKLGVAITHWLDVGYLFIFNQQDIKTTCSYDADLVAIWQDTVANRVLGTNITVLIRMSQTTFAISDGNSVIYIKDKGGQVTRTYSPSAWPTPVNPTYGIARVLLPGGVDVHDGGVGLMGCTCNDTSPALLQCHVITRNGNVWVLPVQWSLSSETQLLTCSRLRISVQSIRWPQRRVVASQLTSSSTTPTNCLDSASCLAGDVAIYVVPICGSSDGFKAMACFPEKLFSRGICFPYCMAVRMQHEGLQPLTMRGAAEWEHGVVIAKRDCIPVQKTPSMSNPTTTTTTTTTSANIQTICSISVDSAGQTMAINTSTTTLTSPENSQQCNYDYTCTTVISDKSVVSGYSAKSHVIPYINSASGGARLVLDGQPLAMAAGIQMRMYKSPADNDAYFVDFPTLVGNQYNEFTVEVNSPVGIPVVAFSGSVPSQSRFYERAGYIFPPPEYVQSRIPYNPATVSTEALWYAANPSYEWAYAMINYCASRGNISQTQIMMLSSYAPTRLWRIRYQDGGCFISSQDGGHVCSSDIATSSSIDLTKELSVMSSKSVSDSTQLYDTCVSGVQFNLWVESLEDFDDVNIVVGVRRGSMSDIATLLSENTETKGKTVFYFVKKSDITKIQESVPWRLSSDAGGPDAEIFDLSCPALRFLPDFGAVVGHSLAAVFHLFKTPVNFMLNPFAILELLNARALQTCPENNLIHSTLDDCGMALVSFNDLFQSIYKSSHATWDIVSWLSSVLAPSQQQSTQQLTPEAEIFHSFLQGASVVADATKTVTLFDVVRVVEGMDTGVQQAVLGRRRRLLSAGMTFLSHASKGVKNGHKAVFSLTKMVGSAVMGSPFAGADFGMLLASQNPTVNLIGSAISAPAIAWAHFTYEASVPIVLDALAAAKLGKFSFAPLWVNIYQAAGLYDELIENRHHQACMGFRLMLGYTSSLGKGVFYNCLAGADMAKGMLSIALVVFVDIPLYRCMCVRAAGQNYVSFVGEECMSMIPSSRKAFWQKTMFAASTTSTGEADVQNMCKLYLQGIEEQTFGAFDSWTTNAELSAEFLASFLDEVLVPNKGKTGCSNVVSNPTAMVLTPLPASHYQICAQTSMCMLKCADSLNLFNFELTRLKNVGYATNVPQNTFDLSAESPMFNRYASSSYDTITSDTIVSMASSEANDSPTESSCFQRCGKGSRCLSVLIQKPEPPNMFKVQYFCVPESSMIMSTLFNTGIDSFVLSDADDWVLNQGVTVTNAEFSLQNKTTFVLVYITRLSTAVSSKDETTSTTSHEIHVFDPDSFGDSTSRRILRSEDLAAEMLNPQMQKAIFGGAVDKPQITDCFITSIVEIASGQDGKLVFFLSFSANIKVFISPTSSSEYGDNSGGGGGGTSNPELSQQGYSIHAIVHWCHDSLRSSSSCTSDRIYYIPCPLGCTTTQCQSTCHTGLDAVISLSKQGNLLHIKENKYLFLPSSETSTSSNLNAGFVTIDPFYGVLTPPTTTTSTKKTQNSKLSSFLSGAVAIAPYAQNLKVLGSWTRSDAFSIIPSLSKPVRDIRAHSTTAFAISSSNITTQQTTTTVAIPYFFQTSGGSLSTEWLQQVRSSRGNRGLMLNMYTSQNTSGTLLLNVNCTHTTCSGCATARLRLLCHAAQDCAITKCIGTVIQTRNVLCGIGNVMQQTSSHAILTWRAMFMSIAEIGLLIMRGLSGEIIKTISLKFPTDQFYTLVCSCKDMYASVVGLGTSICQMFTASLSSGGGGLDLTGKQDVGALVGESTLKATSMAGLLFNAISGSTLLPTLAMHRWLICMANSSFSHIETDQGTISINFGDVGMDKSWLPCAKIGGISNVLNSDNTEESLGTVIEMFVSFTLSLMSGIGETLLYGLQLSFDSSLDFLIGMVWGLQDVLYTFNLRECKVPNSAMRYVLWCSCGDTAYRIPDTQRSHGVYDGGMWCVGTLSLTIIDGTNSIIYNPYTLKELSDGLKGAVSYIDCLSSSKSPSSCTLQASSSLQVLVDQGVEPIAVWAKCKSNYLQSSWDIGSGVLFLTDINVNSDKLTPAIQQGAIDWAKKSIGSDFLQCMQEPARLQIDYSSCMRIFFNVTQQRTPNSYFVYDKVEGGNNKNEPPDACLVFSGLNSSAGAGSPLQTKMNDCSMQEGVGNTASCDLNPLIWSEKQAPKAAAASLHGTSPPSFSSSDHLKMAQILYKTVLQKLEAEFTKFNLSFKHESQSIDAALFSADGDFIHDFFDCVFMGPYTRVDALPCDREGNLDCPFYARDDAGGKSRDFTPCFGDIMYNDHRLPFTCGSQARRSIIKFFFRNFSKSASGEHLSGNISNTILKTVQEIYKNYTSPGSMGCLDKNTGTCHLEACSFYDNGYAPCMETSYEISSEKVGEFIINAILKDIDEYFQYTMQDTLPWTLYYNMSGPPTSPIANPFQWKQDSKMAAVAEKISHFSPSIPLLSFTANEVYSMPLSTESPTQRNMGSIWATCMALLSQAAMTIPTETKTFKTAASAAEDDDLPIGAQNIFGKNVDMSNLDQVEMLIRNITQQASLSNNPFIWHKARRHAPSPSKVCKKTDSKISNPHVQGRLKVGPVTIIADKKPFTVRKGEDLSFPFHGFLQRSIGEAHSMCICGFNHHEDIESCVISVESCSSFLNLTTGTTTCQFLNQICTRPPLGMYSRQDSSLILNCLETLPGVRCPELGPSDLWGLFPVDCTNQECDSASSWVSTGSTDILMEGARFINEGRAGLRLPNYKHVNNTFQEAIHYAAQSQPASTMQQPKCFDIPELAPSKVQEDEADLSDDFIKLLLPASQLVFDSQAVSVCSRYIIEVARSEAMKYVSPSSAQSALLQVAVWKKKCESKLRHLSMCNMNGVFYDVPPPSNWAELAVANGCEITVNLPPRSDFKGRGSGAYLTPWCTLVDRLNRKMYDANLCVYLAKRQTCKCLINWEQDISDMCLLVPQPLSIIKGDVPYTMLFNGSSRLVEDDWLSDLSQIFDISSVDTNSNAQSSPSRDHISHVLDWWPDSIADMPPGYHPTASSDFSELAPSLFDSHYMYDTESHIAHYVHSTARNGSLVYNVAGAAGVCRATSVTMPMFETNTNRACSRMAKSASEDIPTMPVQNPKLPGGGGEEVWPFSEAFMDKYFEKELCAATEFEVPWQSKENDPQSQSAGGIPGWQQYVTMDGQGRTTYDTTSDSYPPESYELSDLHTLNHGWGPCASAVKWGVAPTCTTEHSQDCISPISTCLPLKKEEMGNVSDGICFSTATFEKSIKLRTGRQQIRQPCFNTFHCPDGMVCLADGGCSALYLHMWNDPQNTWPMEFTVIADSCGFKEKTHPYTQSTRGASPWERVPDLLHAHGMCSHHNWFSYRHSVRTKLCPSPKGKDILTCNTTETDWPWIFQHFNLKRTTSATRLSMSEEKMLLTQPHPCDDIFMHLQTPRGKRMEICSGYEGHRVLVNTNAYLSYALTSSASTTTTTTSATWADAIPSIGAGEINGSSTGGSSSSQWMRTYSEATGNIDIGIIQSGLESDVPLGFIGANQLADDVVGDMAFGKERVNFFRCSDRLSCSNPPFRYNGVSVERLNPETKTSNFTESSLRFCGAIGYLPSWSNQVCILDIALFPLFAQILWGDEISNTLGCGALWARRDLMAGSSIGNDFVVLLESDQTVKSVETFTIIASPSLLFCENRGGMYSSSGQCMYAARSSSRLTTLNAGDSVASIISNLNHLIQSAGDVVINAVRKGITATRTYEHINKCTTMLMEKIMISQADILPVYGTQGPSGLYFSFRLTLYEIPLSWIHHAMLVTLLSVVDPKNVQAPRLNQMGSQKISLMLWSPSDRGVCSNDAELDSKPVLWRIICLNSHPSHTFNTKPYLLADKMVTDIKSRAQTDIQNNLLTNDGDVEVYCFNRASWDCENLDESSSFECRMSMIQAHNTSVCEQQLLEPSTSAWQDPCVDPQHFKLDQKVQVSLEELSRNMASGGLPTAGLNKYLLDTKEKMLKATDSIANPIDYVGGTRWGDAASSATNQLPIVRVWNIQPSAIEQATAGFNLTLWLSDNVCQSKPYSICVDQLRDTSITDTCLYPVQQPEEETNRYQISGSDIGSFSEPVITITYADSQTQTINICELMMASSTDTTQPDICIVQHGENADSLNVDVQSQLVSCDITSVLVPPGFQVQTFAFGLREAGWTDLLDKSKSSSLLDKACTESASVASCTWRSNGATSDPTRNSWWMNGYTFTDSDSTSANEYISYLSGFTPLYHSFESMGDWWDTDKTLWKSYGCSTYSGVCAIRVKMENIPGISKGVCSRSDQSSPNCPKLMGSETSSRHSIFQSSNTDGGGYNLDRCGPCTKQTSTISSDGLFGCFLSDDNGATSDEILTQNAVDKSVKYLHDANILSKLWNGEETSVESRLLANGTSLDIMSQLSSIANPSITESLLKWGKLVSSSSQLNSNNEIVACNEKSPSGCWAGFDSTYSSKSDLIIWDKAVSNPGIQFTMMCKEQPYTEKDFQTCNSKLDVRRKLLSDFVDSQYRYKNGMWMQTVDVGMGSAWKANVAHSTVGMFSIMHASTNRKETEVLSKWILGSSPCSTSNTVLQDRVCVESTVGNGGAFQAVHPWVGGDFNPFEGLDECPGNTDTPLCPCVCEPKWACEDPLGSFNYSEVMMRSEFPDNDACRNQAFPQTRIMQSDDESDICNYARSSALPNQCLLHQGILGGLSVSHSVTSDELHGEGVQTSSREFLIQGMYDIGKNGIWSGQTTLQEADAGQTYAFLKMSRDQLHPGHIAFGLDSQKTGSPLVMKAVALLPYDDDQTSFPGIDSSWISTLTSQWEEDKLLIQKLYPQLAPQTTTTTGIADWSCPLRAAIFWGGGYPDFSPLIPNPLLSNLLYPNMVGGGGAHPLIQVRSIHENLAQYQTTNGGCFYQKGTNGRTAILLSDEQNQCGLKGMLAALNKEGQYPTLSRVVNHFTERCNDIMDTPDLNAQLRSGEAMPSSSSSSSSCGVLHRLSPFLLATRGNAASIKRHTAGLTTRSEGGDCHMGRALLQKTSSRSNAAGRLCTLSSKNTTHAISQCPFSSSGATITAITFNRAQKLHLQDIVKKTKRLYREQMGVEGGVPEFWGPGGIKLQEAEVSFGLLYAASLKRVLASDLLHECKLQPLCNPISDSTNQWLGANFYSKYIAGDLINSSATSRGSTSTSSSSNNNNNNLTATPSSFEQGVAADNSLWNALDWTWSFLSFQEIQTVIVSGNNNTNSSRNNTDNITGNKTSTSTSTTTTTLSETMTRKAKGTVIKADWLQNRFGACNASYHQYAYTPNSMKTSVRAITLCEPAPTEGLQAFCKSMLQYRTDVANINCQIMGGKDCMYQPGMFYMPYMWSPTNQEFMADTVLTYYESIVTQKRYENESFTSLCPARNDLSAQLAKLSRIQAAQCPGYQIEYLKDVLQSIKLVGKDILYMGYCLVMFVVNILGSAFSAGSPAAFTAMSRMAIKYIGGFIDTASKVIMPVLDAMVNILFGTSSVGSVIKESLYYLCMTYNALMKYFYIPGWCGVIRPGIYVILKFIKSLVSAFDTNTGKQINDIWVTIAGGDYGLSIDDTRQCLGSIKLELECRAKDSLDRQDNASEFLIQPVATRCWVDSISGNSGAGSVLSGSSGNSYLSCTASDTCAKDPLNFDSYNARSDLSSCASCPYIPLEEMAQRFGCNTYLKRCTCGIRSKMSSECLTNSDCNQYSTCSVASGIDFVRDAATTMPCSECGWLGSESVCVMDRADTTGVCACVSVSQSESLHSCSQSILGQRVPLLEAKGQCLVTNDPNVNSVISPSLVLEFTTLAIAPCALGIANSACLTVKLPMSSGGQYPRYLAVILGISSSSGFSLGGGGRRRRLLQHTESIFENNPSTWNWSANSICNQTFSSGSKTNGIDHRVTAKWCIHWMLVANLVHSDFNLTLMKDHDLLTSVPLDNLVLILSNQEMITQLLSNPKALRFIIRQHNGLFPVILDTLLGISTDVFSVIYDRGTITDFNATTNFTPTTAPSNVGGGAGAGRKILQLAATAGNTAPITLRLPTLPCTALEVPLQQISSAFWDTIRYYDSKFYSVQNNNNNNNTTPANKNNNDNGSSSTADQNNNSNNTNYTEGTVTSSSSWYSLPPTTSNPREGGGWLVDLTNNVLLFTTGGTTDGTQIMDAILSDIPYNETISNNYFTGRRFLREISTCNYTALTFGSHQQRALLPWLIFLLILFVAITTLCSPSLMITWFMWIFIFPAVLFWAVYNISPLCWPMIPPKFPHDVAAEFTTLIPESIEIPTFLVDRTCSVRGLLSDGTYDSRCFKQCSKDPFLMLSWQDPAAWWLCDIISTDACLFAGKSASTWGVFQDFTSSTSYYAEVIAFGSKDNDFVGAHRLCAFFMSYELVFAFMALVMVIFILPSIIQTIVEIFSGAVILLMYASNAEATEDY